MAFASYRNVVNFYFSSAALSSSLLNCLYIYYLAQTLRSKVLSENNCRAIYYLQTSCTVVLGMYIISRSTMPTRCNIARLIDMNPHSPLSSNKELSFTGFGVTWRCNEKNWNMTERKLLFHGEWKKVKWISHRIFFRSLYYHGHAYKFCLIFIITFIVGSTSLNTNMSAVLWFLFTSISSSILFLSCPLCLVIILYINNSITLYHWFQWKKP